MQQSAVCLVSVLFAVLLSLSIGNELLASATARYRAVAVALVVKASDTLGYTDQPPLSGPGGMLV